MTASGKKYFRGAVKILITGGGNGTVKKVEVIIEHDGAGASAAAYAVIEGIRARIEKERENECSVTVHNSE